MKKKDVKTGVLTWERPSWPSPVSLHKVALAHLLCVDFCLVLSLVGSETDFVSPRRSHPFLKGRLALQYQDHKTER